MRKPLVKRPDLSICDLSGEARQSPGMMSRKPLLTMLGLTVGLTLSSWGYAVGLGGINVVSALGQPLKAEIELVALSKSDKPSLVARLAPPDAYKGAGLEYPYGVKYNFTIENRANGEAYLKLTSSKEINDPFVSLLVELSWSSGRLMREYTFLLDPPGYVPVQPKTAATEGIVPATVQSVPLSPQQAGAAPAGQVETTAQPAEKSAQSAPARSAVKRASGYHKPAAAGGEIAVKDGDTLNKIAAQVKPENVSLERMLVALYRANADQFDGRNMNRIRSGRILRMPEQSAVNKIAQVEAVHEIQAQSADWNAYRRRLAGAATTVQRHEAPRQVATGKISSPAVDKTPVAPESAKEVLRLSRGEAPSGKAGAAGRSAQDKANAEAEEAIAKSKALNEEKTRAALLESNLKDMQRLAQLKSEAAALAASAAAATVTGESGVMAASSVAAASAVAPARHAAPASAVKPVETPEVSLIDQLLGSPLLLGIGAAALIALGGLGIVFNRRRQAAAKVGKPADMGATTGHLATPVAPSPDTGDFTASLAPAEPVVQQAEEIDPISEAELFLNFGRDEQAEEVLKDALRHSPDNHQVHLKLLGIYANRNDAESFAKIQQLLQRTGDEEAIGLAEVMARKFETPATQVADTEDSGTVTQMMEAAQPDEFAEFAGLEEPAAEEAEDQLHAIDFDVTSTFPSQKTPAAEVDFDVTSTTPSMAAFEEASTAPSMVDFDVTSTAPSMAAGLDFDIAGAAPEPVAHEEEDELPNLDDLIFDVMSPETETEAEAETTTEEAAPQAAEVQQEDDGMEFTLDFPMDEAEETPAPIPPSVNLADISLEMDDIGTPEAQAPEAEKSEQWHEVATKLDLARAYQEMGDEVGAREILEEVVQEGDEAQKQEAQLLIKQLS